MASSHRISSLCFELKFIAGRLYYIFGRRKNLINSLQLALQFFWDCPLIGEENKAFSLFGAKKCPLIRMSANGVSLLFGQFVKRL